MKYGIEKYSGKVYLHHPELNNINVYHLGTTNYFQDVLHRYVHGIPSIPKIDGRQGI